MFEERNEIFKNVYKLAKCRRVACEKKEKSSMKKDISDINIEALGYSDEERALYDYLNSLDFEDVKIIQTIMYLGRDMDYGKSDPPDAIYRKNREYMDELGWNDKEIEVSQIVQKVPLDNYLKNGFKILKIEI